MNDRTTQDRRVALVTGANKGIGLETARQLGRRGMVVLVGARDAKAGEAAARLLRDEGLDARHVPLDVTDPASITAAARAIAAEPGRLDVLVNNAGIALGMHKPSETDLDVVRRSRLRQSFTACPPTAHAGRFAGERALVGLLVDSSDDALADLR